MRLVVLPLCLLCLLVVLPGCPTEEPEELEDISWEPPLSSNSGGELNFGAVPEGESESLSIVGTNNTEETFEFEIDVDLDASEGWLVSVPPPVDVGPGAFISFGPRFNPNATTPDESSGTVAFLWDDHVVTYVIEAEVDRD
jgi:hypothetical protein